MNKNELIVLRNIALDLHQQAGQSITIPTDGAIAGSADQNVIRQQLTPILTQILTDVSEMLTAINAPVLAGAFVVGEHRLSKQ